MNALPSRSHVACDTEPEGVTGPATILLVEDEPTIRGIAKMYLERDGHHVIPAVDGEEAMELWRQRRAGIDLVLTDLMLPRSVNGYQLVERLQAEQPDLKAIFMSGSSVESFGAETARDKNINFLQKPYRLKNLASMVHGCLDRTCGA